VEQKSFWSQSWPATVIRCRRSANPPEAHQRRTAEKLDGKYLELDAGHYPMLSDPDALAPLLMGA
jgi:pimeloyl-ACP methyl ester carboxylesterase